MAAGRGRAASVIGQAVLSLLVPGAVLRADDLGDPWLVDVTAETGLAFEHVRGAETRYWLPEIMSGGVCLLDSDGDGDLDVYFVQGGVVPADPEQAGADERNVDYGNVLYRNDGAPGFVDVARAAGVDDSGYGMGCAVGDVDGDGAIDLYVTNLGPNVLYRNLGDGRFERLEASGAEDSGWGSSAAFFDYDLDGDADLFLVNYIDWSADREIDCFSGGLRDYCHPDRFRAPARDRLLQNQGDGRFLDVSDTVGLGAARGNGLGVVVGDFDGDFLPDVYVANDGMANQLWVNQGDGRFLDGALLAGVAVNRAGSPEAGMGVQAVDVDGDLALDLFVTHLRSETNTLYLNQGGGQFADRTAASGLGAPSLGLTGFGLGFSDFDQDGRLDLYVGNGRVGRGLADTSSAPFAEPDQLYRGLDGGRFELVGGGGGVTAEAPVASRGVALGDLDLDGDVDLVLVASGASARLLRNEASAGGWSAVREAAGGHLSGARVLLSATGRSRLGLLEPAYSYCSASEARAHFGLGDLSGQSGTVESIEISPTSGGRRLFRSPPADRTLVVPAR